MKTIDRTEHRTEHRPLPDHDPLLAGGRPPLAELRGQAPERLPRPGPDGMRRDVRGDWIGCEEAARIVGIKRTQMWRIASAGKIACHVFGTQNRPEYKFLREDVEWYARERRAKKTLRTISRTHTSLRIMQEMARRHQLGPTLAAILNQNKRGAVRRMTNPLDLSQV